MSTVDNARYTRIIDLITAVSKVSERYRVVAPKAQ